MLRAFFIMALLLSALAGTVLMKPAIANFMPENPPNAIYIKANSGNVEPATSPIKRVGNIYTLTGEINQPIVIQRDNIILDGAGFTLQGNGKHAGIDLSYKRNVTISNINVKSFFHGIFSYDSRDNTISGNTVTENEAFGIYLIGAHNSIISDNIVENNGEGIKCTGTTFHHSSYIVGNIVQYNERVGIYNSTDNILNDNIVENNGVNISLNMPEATSQPEPTPSQEPTYSPDHELHLSDSELIISVVVIAIVIGAGLGLLINLIKRKEPKII